MRKYLALILIIMCTFMMFSCDETYDEPKDDPTTIMGTWYLTEMNGTEGNYEAYITFIDESSAVGKGGCNGFFAEYTPGEKLLFNNLYHTKKACVDVLYENEFFGAVIRTATYEIIDTQLVFYDCSNQLITKWNR